MNCRPKRWPEGKGVLKNIDPLLTPELLKAPCEMGQGDELVRAVIAQAAAGDPGCDDSQWDAVESFAFYERAARAYTIVQTGEMQARANLVFKKGLIADWLIE